MMRTGTSGEGVFVVAFRIGLVCAALTTGAAAQQNPPVPDFSSNQVGWISIGENLTALPGASGPGPIYDDPRYPYVPNNAAGKQPTFRIADLGNPNLKPWVKERMKKDNDEVLAGKIAFTPRSSCMPAGVPGFMTYLGGPVYFVQSSKEVLIIYAPDQQVRRVYLDVPHSARPQPSWYGESVGHYEGDTLVVDTIGMNDKTFIDGYRTPHTEKLHVLERWKLADAGNALEVSMTVEDPDAFYRPWSAIRRYRRVRQAMNEEVCAENNTAHFADYHIPEASKPDF
jgi:hypothetical protein